jgi:hypothetical protein
MLSTQGFTLHKDRPTEGEELFETKMHTQKMKCASFYDEKFHSVILPPTSTKFETIKKKDGGLNSPSNLLPNLRHILYIYI